MAAASYPFGQWTVSLVVGDIAHLPFAVDAIVSSDDSYLSHGGGASEAIWAAAGCQLVEHHPAGCRVGDVVVSGAGELQAKAVLHAITIDLDDYVAIGLSECTHLYGAVLDKARELGFTSIATPLLGGGVAGLGELPVVALADALDERAWDPDQLQVVHLVVFDEETLDVVQTVLATRSHKSPSLSELVDAASDYLPTRDSQQIHEAFGQWRAATDAAERAWRGHDFFLAVLSATLAPARSADSGDLSAHDLLDLVSTGRDIAPISHKAASLARLGYAERSRLFEMDGPADQEAARVFLAAAAGLLSEIGDGVEEARTSFPRRDRTEGIARTEPVRKLAALLGRELHTRQLQSLLSRLRAEGFTGTDEICVLEYCVSTAPDEVVRRAFSGDTVLDLLEAGGIHRQPGISTSEAVVELLETLGFQPEVQPDGIGPLKEWLRENQVALTGQDASVLRGMALELSTRVERLLLHLLGFYCHVGLGMSAERWADECSDTAPAKPLRKTTLGQRVNMVTRLSKLLRSSDSPRAKAVIEDLGGRKLLPPEVDELTNLRNRVAHSAEAGSELSEAELRQKVVRLFDCVATVLEHLGGGEPAIFPQVVFIDEVRVDRWQRRHVAAISDDGRREVIFTDIELVPGRSYLMRPLSNPLRVDPLLVPMGNTA